MAVAKYNSPSLQGSNIASTTLDSLANSTSVTTGISAFVTHDNSTNLDLYASVLVNLGSITPATGGSISLRVFSAQSSDVPDASAGYGGGDNYTAPLTTTTGVKVVVFPRIALYPESMRLAIINNTGVTLAASGNSIKVRPYNEQVS